MPEPTTPAEITVLVEELDGVVLALEAEEDDVAVTLEEAQADFSLVVSDVQGTRGPRGAQGETGPQGAMGPRGLTGASAGSVVELPKWSLSPLSAGSLVRLFGVDHCARVSALDARDAVAAIGVVREAVSAPELEVKVLVYGEHEDDTWDFAPGGALFVGPEGLLTQTIDPSWAFVRVVGVAMTPTRVFIDPQVAVIRGG